MSKVNIKDSIYNKETKESLVIITTDIGIFEGKAKLNQDDDSQYESSFAGCTVAEYRALLKYLKAKKTRLNISLNTLKNLKKDYKKIGSDINSNEFKKLEDNILKMEKQKDDYNKIIASLYNHINEYIDTRIKFLKEKEEKKQGK